MIVVPKLHHDDIAFCGVFDGTVGPHASEFVVRNILDILMETEDMTNVSTASSYEYSVVSLIFIFDMILVVGYDDESLGG